MRLRECSYLSDGVVGALLEDTCLQNGEVEPIEQILLCICFHSKSLHLENNDYQMLVLFENIITCLKETAESEWLTARADL